MIYLDKEFYGSADLQKMIPASRSKINNMMHEMGPVRLGNILLVQRENLHQYLKKAGANVVTPLQTIPGRDTLSTSRVPRQGGQNNG